MKVELDENLGSLGMDFLRAAGFDVATAADQGLRSAPEAKILQACVAEDRCLVTLDKDFSNPLQYPPNELRRSRCDPATRSSTPRALGARVGDGRRSPQGG